jgi:hypothetical protein
VTNFERIKQLMEWGLPFYRACKELKIDRSTEYYKLSLKQKRELDEIRFLHSTGERAKYIIDKNRKQTRIN